MGDVASDGRAFVEVVADTSGTERQMQRDMEQALSAVQAALPPIDVQAALDSTAGRQVVSEMERVVREAQAALPDVQVQVDTSQATAQIEQFTRDANGRLRDARGRFVSSSRALGDALGDGVGGGSDRASGMLQRLIGSLGGVTSGLSGVAAAAPQASGALIAVAASVGATTAATLGLGTAFAGLGVAALKDTPAVEAAFTSLGQTIKAVMQGAAEPLEGPLLDALHDVQDLAVDLGPILQEMFAASEPFLKALISGVEAFARNALGGFNTALQTAGPLADSLNTILGELGQALGDTVEALAQDPEGTALALEEIIHSAVILLPTLGNLASAITSLAGPVLASLNGGLMVTATALDEFASIVESVGDLLRGDASEAADEWTGKAQRRLVDRTKESTDATDSFSSALDNALKSLKDTSDTTTEASTVSSIYASQVAYVNTKLAQQKADADGLRQSIFALTAETRSALDAESAYESAVDSVSKVLKDNGAVLRMRNGELDLGSEKSRTAYDALSQLAQQTEDWSAKVLESTGSVTQSNAVLDQGRRKLIDQADALGLTKAQAKALADQLIATPDKVISVKGDLADLKAKLADAEQRLRNARGSKRVDIQGDIANLKRKISQARAELQSLNNVKILINANIAPAGRPSAAFAEGGIVRSAVHALVGEAGPEVVIPLTKPDRARELAEKSGLTGLLGQQAPTPVVNNYITLDGQELRHVARQEIADDQRRRAQGIRR